MNTRQLALALLATVALAPASNLLAQRRTSAPSGSSGSSGRAQPSSGGSRASGGESRRSGSGTSTSRPSSSGTSSGTSAGTRSRDGGTSTSNGTTAQSGEQSSRGAEAQAQGRAQPASGKIGAAKARAADVRARTSRGGGVIYTGGIYVGSCFDCYYWGGYGGRWGWYDGGWWYPARRYHGGYYGGGSYYDDRRDRDEPESDIGQGYLPYPYAETDGTGETFVRSRTTERHAFGAVSGYYFSDLGSTTRAGNVALEGALRSFRADVEYGSYAEPVAGHTDHFQTLRFSVGIQPALGKQAYLIAGLGARGVFLGDGSNAGGPEGTLGIQVFPVRPIGLNVTGRLAAMTWTGQDHFSMSELNTTGSVFLGRIELQGGWHWLKMQGSPGFGGPVIGTRIWF